MTGKKVAVMRISVVIPTCNRKVRLLSLLQNLDRSACPVEEVIIVDSGTDRIGSADYAGFTRLAIQHIISVSSVCIQRNTGIRLAQSSWIFLCDDDIEIPPDYLQKLVNHIEQHPETGAVSGVWLQQEQQEWKGTYPVQSSGLLWWKFIFQLGFWGEINCSANNVLTRRVKEYYTSRGNHISKAGWPVNVDFTGEYAICPVYTLGASLVKKEWLIHSPFDEVLDRHGIGDNYGVALDFPVPGIHIVNNVFVYHHKEPVNRLKEPLQYYRRTLALDYFIRSKPALKHIKRSRVIWSLTGNLLGFLLAGDYYKLKAALKSIVKIGFNKNPYVLASRENRKVMEPVL